MRVTAGTFGVLAASAGIENCDDHVRFVPRSSGGLRGIKIPFSELKRLRSEQTSLNVRTITSINLVASGLQKGSFADTTARSGSTYA